MDTQSSEDRGTVLATVPDKDGTPIKIDIKAYNKMLDEKNRSGIADMIYHRFYGRYLKPFMFPSEDYKENFKNGFAMMASACLLIEALESFFNGWEDSKSHEGEQVFQSFFKRFTEFTPFLGIKFYSYIRCGILHQAETKGGYSISRKPADDLFNAHTKKINASKFLDDLQTALDKYRQELSTSPWDSEIWDNLRRKMRFIIKHCEP